MSGMPPPDADASGSSDTVVDKWLLPLIVLTVGQFMAVLDMTIVNIAIPTLGNEFGAATDDIEWVATIYSLTLGVVAPASGWLADKFGPTRLFTGALAFFAVASGLCGVAWNLGSMIAFRILQAVPGGVIPMITMLIIFRIVPKDKLGSAMGIFGIGVIMGPALGPTLGGWLLEHTSWHLIFFINVPVGLIGALVCMVRLPKLAGTPGRSFDLLGFVCAAGGLFGLLLVLHEGKTWRWTSYPTLILATASILSLALFVVIQFEREEPLINLRVLKTFPYTVSLLLIMCVMVSMQAVMFFLTLFIQQVRGLEPLPAGMVLLPQALAMMVVMPIAGQIFDRFGARIPAVTGLALATYGTWLLTGITPDTTTSQLMWWTSIRALGTALAMMPIFTAGLNAIPPEYANAGTQLNSIMQELAGSLGLAAMSVLTTSQMAQLMADRSSLIQGSGNTMDQSTLLGQYQQLQAHVTSSAYSNMFLACTALSGLGIVLAFMLRGAPKPAAAAPTPVLADAQEPTEPQSAPADEPQVPVAMPVAAGRLAPMPESELEHELEHAGERAASRS